MHAFIEASLFLARESSSSISQHQTANITEIIENLIDDNATAIEQANIHLELSLESHLIVHQPKSILQIVIGNILRNAIEHSAGNRISITLKGDTLIIADSGEGIETDHLPRVFEASFTTKAGGTGLGLNLVKRICERFHWRLDIKSIKGQGTEVQIVFN
jgi:signal transduction histidine kinase